MKRSWGIAAAILLVLLATSSCAPSKRGHDRGSSGTAELVIASGSENKSLEPLIQSFAESKGEKIRMEYKGSLEIANELARGLECPYDAVWPASSIAINLGDTSRVVKHSQSIFQSPVVFAVKKSVAQRLGWVGREVKVRDILAAAESGRLRFGMTSATQSNSGAMFYLACLSAFAGNPEVLRREDLANEDVQKQIRSILGTVHRSSGSSGWLMDLLLERYDIFDAVVNYESLVIETNQKLVERGLEPLYVIYPVDGLSIADSPLAYVNHGDAAKERRFQELQQHLLSAEVQQQIQRTGRRVSALGGSVSTVDPEVFNPAWGVDAARVLSPIRLPAEAVLREALNLYQTAFRKPSLTVYVLDYSGSMEGNGERQLKEAMRSLLDPTIASRYLLQPSARDLSVVIAFSDDVEVLGRVKGNDPDSLRALLWQIERRPAAGGTAIFRAASKALELLERQTDSFENYHVAILVMSDGENTIGHRDELADAFGRTPIGRRVPIYTIRFGAAKAEEMDWIAEQTSGRSFDGREDMIKAFREAKGYN